MELLEICAESCFSSAFKTVICDLATKFFIKELDEFISTSDISKPTMTVTPEIMTSFSVYTLSETMMKRVPLLSQLFQGVVAGDNTKRTEIPICDPEIVSGFSDKEEEMSIKGKLLKVVQRREK